MGTVGGGGGGWSLACVIFQRVTCMKIVLINRIWIGSGFGVLILCSFSC